MVVPVVQIKSNMKKNSIIFALLLLPLLVSGQFTDPHYGSFMPYMGRSYLVSCWVKEDYAAQQKSYSHSVLNIQFLVDLELYDEPEFIYNFTPSGNIIDGWQRIVGIITIPTPPSSIGNHGVAVQFKLVNTNSSNVDAYFDDVRFLPYNGNLKSFVYDRDTQKLLAELDENNYATFYEYDQEGGLIRVKKETENGIFTIQETRSKNAKKIIEP